jgi:hypothetical protein
MKTMTDFEKQQEQNEELALSGKYSPLEFAKALILLLALTLASAQPLHAYRDYFDEDNRSEDGLTTAEEVRRLREDLREAREQSALQKRIDEKSEDNEWFASLSQKDQEMLTKNEPY